MKTHTNASYHLYPQFSPLPLSVLAITLSLFTTRSIAQTLPLSENLINFNSSAGEKLLVESQARQDYFPLSINFITQENQAYCGVASMVMVLNALEVSPPKASNYGNYRLFTQENFFDNPATGKVIAANTVRRMGMTLEQLAGLLASYEVQTEVYHGGDVTLAQFRALVVENLEEKDNFVLVNYLRKAIAQERGGHISPIAAYHAATDRFLILDVSRYKYPPVWVKAEELWQAMATADRVSGKTRGFVLINRGKN